MRAGLRPLLPGLAHWFGVMPWDVERLTLHEIDTFVKALPTGEARRS